MKRIFTLGFLVLVLAGCKVYQTKGPAEASDTDGLTPICKDGKQTVMVDDDGVREQLANGATLGRCG